jgi:hypothetical protein
MWLINQPLQSYSKKVTRLDRLEELIKIRQTDLQATKDVFSADRIFAELDALE